MWTPNLEDLRKKLIAFQKAITFLVWSFGELLAPFECWIYFQWDFETIYTQFMQLLYKFIILYLPYRTLYEVYKYEYDFIYIYIYIHTLNLCGYIVFHTCHMNIGIYLINMLYTKWWMYVCTIHPL